MNPRRVLELVNRTLLDSDQLPELGENQYIAQEADVEGGDANIPLPLVETTVVSNVRAARHNTDLVGYTTDDNGYRTGRIFDAEFDMSLQISVWTVENARFDPENLMEKARKVLRRHEAAGPDKPFLDEDGNSMNQIHHFQLSDSDPDNDLSKGPGLYRVLQEADLRFSSRIKTDETPVRAVDYPRDGEFTAGSTDAVAIEYTSP